MMRRRLAYASDSFRRAPLMSKKPAPTILIVEDDADTRDVVGRLLSGAGYNVRVAANGWEGLLALENHVDLVLLDVMLPGMDGVAFLTHLRRQKNCATIPVVIMNAMDVAGVAGKVHGLGVRYILPKGEFLYPRLNDTLKRLLASPDHPYHVELPSTGGVVRPYLDVYLRVLAWN
jgi:CheY-like chemotaxis protein